MMYFVMHVNLVFYVHGPFFVMSFQDATLSASLLNILLVFLYKFDASRMHGYEAVRTIRVVCASVIFVIALAAIYHSGNIYF
jgi:hypothetical protein